MTSDPLGVVCCACSLVLLGAGFRSWGGPWVFVGFPLCGLLVGGVLMVWSLHVMWWAVLVMVMVRVVWVMQWVIASLVVPMARVVYVLVQVTQPHCVAVDVLSEGAVGNVAGDGGTGDAGAEGGVGNASVDGEVGGVGGDGVSGSAGDGTIGCVSGDANGEGGLGDIG